MMEEEKRLSAGGQIVNHNTNCQVFNGPISGSIFAMPGSTVVQNPVQQVAYEGFRSIGEREVSGTITVPAAQLEALFAMTPYYWKTPRDGAARLAALPELTTDIAFRFLVFEKEQ